MYSPNWSDELSTKEQKINIRNYILEQYSIKTAKSILYYLDLINQLKRNNLTDTIKLIDKK